MKMKYKKISPYSLTTQIFCVERKHRHSKLLLIKRKNKNIPFSNKYWEKKVYLIIMNHCIHHFRLNCRRKCTYFNYSRRILAEWQILDAGLGKISKSLLAHYELNAERTRIVQCKLI